MIDYVENRIALLLVFCTLIPYASSQGQCGPKGQPPILTFTPSIISLNRNTPKVNLTVTCKHPVRPKGTARPTRLNMDRALRTSSRVDKVASADSAGLVNHLKARGTTVTGSFSKAINLIVSQAACQDTEYYYECYSTAMVARTSVECVAYGSLDVRSDSSDVQLVAKPDTELFKVGDMLTLTCSATVGVKGEAKNEAEWVWEVKESGGSWKRLNVHTRLDKLLKINDDCLKVRYTVFKARLKGSDNGKSFRCFVIEDGKSLTSGAGVYTVKVDAFIFGLDTKSGSVVLTGILIIVGAILFALFFIARHFYRRNINRERAQYKERVMNRLDKLLRYEAYLLGGGKKKKKRPTEPEPKPEEPSVDPSESELSNAEPPPAEPEELTIEVVLDTDSESEMESEFSEVSEAPPEEDIIVESSMTGPMHK